MYAFDNLLKKDLHCNSIIKTRQRSCSLIKVNKLILQSISKLNIFRFQIQTPPQ